MKEKKKGKWKIQINGDNEQNFTTKVLRLNVCAAYSARAAPIHALCKASFISSWKTVGAESKMEKQASEQRSLQDSDMGVAIWK